MLYGCKVRKAFECLEIILLQKGHYSQQAQRWCKCDIFESLHSALLRDKAHVFRVSLLSSCICKSVNIGTHRAATMRSAREERNRRTLPNALFTVEACQRWRGRCEVRARGVTSHVGASLSTLRWLLRAAAPPSASTTTMTGPRNLTRYADVARLTAAYAVA